MLTDALPRNLLHIEADPLPIQFVGMTGPTGNQTDLGMPGVGECWEETECCREYASAHFPPARLLGFESLGKRLR